ncbi:malate dehydrogenase [Methanofollis formosanus]|uniref:malate dehydrogenase n=1 Tax=Methanofollis formosanus TaxID=299308 RepID=A0A8G1A2C4_9EURY|nr:malate dehydrogenase [Methanofollis formosanus]QYZ79418.1 malate dehydrogenase [Methanofollis formosanus]
MAKVTIIGATGRLGSFASHPIAGIPHVDEVLLMGRPGRENLLAGLAHDLTDSCAARGIWTEISSSTSEEDCADSDIIVITAGAPRHEGQDRIDLALANARIIRPIAESVGRHAPNAIVLMVSNPVDVMTAVALRYSGMEPKQVFGLGTHLDSMRLKALIADYFHVHVSEVHTRIIGEHGESMVPLWSATTIGGIRISNLPAFSGLPIDEMMQRVKSSGSFIIKNSGATIYGPGDAIATLVQTILGNENRILTVSSYIKSEVHNVGDTCIGVPARVNRRGVSPVPIRIEESELEAFRESVGKIRGITREILEKLE